LTKQDKDETIKFNQSYPIVNHRYTQLNPKKPVSSEEKPRKTVKTLDLGEKKKVWHKRPNHFESTKKLMQFTEQVNVI